MPIIDVEIVGPIAETLRVGLAQRLADAAGIELGSPPQGTWVKVRFLGEDGYAENGGEPPNGAQPVLVSVLFAEVPDGNRLSEQVSSLAAAIGKACGRPIGNIHIVIEPKGAGRVAFGGVLRT